MKNNSNNISTILFKNKKRNYILFSQIISAIFGLFLGKLIATYIEPDSFGLYSLQFGVYTLLFSLFFSPPNQFYKSSINTLYQKIGFKHFGSSMLISNIIVVSFILFYLLFIQNEPVSLFFVFLILFFVPVNLFFKINSDYNNVVDDYKRFSLGTIVKSIAPVLFFIFFININSLRYSESDLIWIVNFFGFLVGSFFIFNKKSIKIIPKKISFQNFFKSQLKFGLPLMLMALLSWSNNYLDRYIIEYYLDLKQVGLYNASYSLGSKFFLLISPLFLILLTPFVYKNESIKAKKKQINRYLAYFLIISIPILIATLFFYNYFGYLLLSENYSEGFILIFWIALAHFFLIATQIVETVFYAEKNTSIILFGVLISAIINLVLNLILIPHYGFIGAAYSTVLTFLARFIYIYISFKKI